MSRERDEEVQKRERKERQPRDWRMRKQNRQILKSWQRSFLLSRGPGKGVAGRRDGGDGDRSRQTDVADSRRNSSGWGAGWGTSQAELEEKVLGIPGDRKRQKKETTRGGESGR